MISDDIQGDLEGLDQQGVQATRSEVLGQAGLSIANKHIIRRKVRFGVAAGRAKVFPWLPIGWEGRMGRKAEAGMREWRIEEDT